MQQAQKGLVDEYGEIPEANKKNYDILTNKINQTLQQGQEPTQQEPTQLENAAKSGLEWLEDNSVPQDREPEAVRTGTPRQIAPEPEPVGVKEKVINALASMPEMPTAGDALNWIKNLLKTKDKKTEAVATEPGTVESPLLAPDLSSSVISIAGDLADPTAPIPGTPAASGKKGETDDGILDVMGLRNDGTQKDKGFLGELQLPGGGVATEYSIGVEIDGQEVEIPTLVPTLTEQERSVMVNDIIPNKKQIPQQIANKAIIHANKRINAGQSPFFDSKKEGKAEKQTPRRVDENITPEMAKSAGKGVITQELANEFVKVARQRLPNGTPKAIKKLAKKLAKKQGYRPK
jgi:hypothetical protein